MNGFLRLSGTIFRAFSPKPPLDVEQVELQVDRPASGVDVEHVQLVERLAQLQDAIRVLDASPNNRTARAMVERYRANERRLTAECHRLEYELGKGSTHGELALPWAHGTQPHHSLTPAP